MDTTKLKKFDLQKALQGDPVIVKWEPFSGKAEYLPAKMVQLSPDGGTVKIMFGDQGVLCITTAAVMYDETIFMAPKVRTVWCNLYKPRNPEYISSAPSASWHESEDEANSVAMAMRLDGTSRLGNRAYPIEITEE